MYESKVHAGTDAGGVKREAGRPVGGGGSNSVPVDLVAYHLFPVGVGRTADLFWLRGRRGDLVSFYLGSTHVGVRATEAAVDRS